MYEVFIIVIKDFSSVYLFYINFDLALSSSAEWIGTAA
ncbi:hypothetical protein LEP1GSC103_2497 [Leptospira borgpetersenii serovar Javanica str. UI 09931]|uniref:Uncharacterized protein n=2 Tax=Leptospira borgpetersenii TaxID=174 RepID=A0ABN0HYP2_LEPBO|nr:hypothetical protein LEP1GSC128_3654 [Leptospira borgpetersenii str. 200801926]ENO65097.1 hypothetical protein LEP1GSC191_2480 [Leptospira borgpetersenii serovar Mini str. 201000851]EPG57859.1 hypothetical protein LEP1GSC103_2497 [Leptospira borgpetersenii serovar Javanica str. UI 09931]